MMETYFPYAILMTCVGMVASVERGFVYCPAYPCTCESKDGGLNVNCMSLYLSALPKFLSFEGRIKELSLRHNSINSLPAGGFKHLHIEKLDLQDNAVNFIHNEAFTGLEHSLRWLSVQLYAMDGFPTAPLSRLSRLRNLIIIGCKEQELRASLFVSLMSLEELHLVGCRITRIAPGTFRALPHLNILVLAKNSLGFENIAEINMLDKLVCLDLSYNDIQYLKSFAFSKLSKLRSLKLGYNKLRYVDDNAFSSLEFSLEELDLQKNYLQEQHLTSLADLKVLRRLDLSFNTISDLSGEYFATMRYLTNLQLGHNNIKVVDRSSFWRLWSVRELVLCANPLQLIQDGVFSETSSLQTLNISNSGIGGSINARTFEGLASSLLLLDVNNSSLVNGDILAFSRLTNLTYLDASHNSVDHLDLNFMAGMENLKHINFSYNNISSFENSYTADSDLSVEFLDLSWNRIRVLHSCLLLPLKKLRDIRLEGNPLSCNCSLSWLYRWQQVAQIKHHQDSYKWTCRTPTSLRGLYFSDLEFSDLRCPDPAGHEERCPSRDNITSRMRSTTAETVQLPDTKKTGYISVNISRPNSSCAIVAWTVDNSEQILAFNLTVKRHDDSTELQSVTVLSSTANYTLQMNETIKQDICVTAVNKERVSLAETCLEVPILQHEGSSETRLNHLIQNSFIPLTFIYISGSLAIVFIAACVVVFVRGKRKLPRRVKPLGVAYPAWLDHRTSVASSTMTHDPHFLNTLFVDNTGTLRSIIDNMGTLRATVSNSGAVQPAIDHAVTAHSTTDSAGVLTTANDPNQSPVLHEMVGPTAQNPEANLPLDSPFTLSSRRESGVDNRGTNQDALVHGLIEIRPRRSDASSEFFFHF